VTKRGLVAAGGDGLHARVAAVVEASAYGVESEPMRTAMGALAAYLVERRAA
jgi:hypothetical protein